MSTTLQFRRAITAELASVVGSEGEIIIDLTKDTVTVHDGITAGGTPLATEAYIDTHLTGGTGITYNSGEISVDASSDVTFNTVSVSQAPTSNSELTTKAYVDEVAQGLQTLPSAEAATTGNLDGTYSANTLTANANGALVVDGVTLSVGDNILVKDQNSALENGSYIVQQTGDASNPWIIERCDFCDESSEVPGSFEFVTAGTTNANTGWVFTVTDPDTFAIGTDPINVVQFSGAGTYQANGGIELNGTVFSHSDTSTQSSINGSGNTFIQDVTLDDYGHVTGLGTATVTIPDTANDATITLSAGNALTGGGNFTTDQSSNETITFAVASNSIGADELNVSGNGTAGNALLSDGDGTFSWGSAGLTTSDLNNLNPIEVGDGNTASGDESSAFGYDNTASGTRSSAFGYDTAASGFASSAVGHRNNASGSNSSAFGYQNTASGNGSSAVGHLNEADALVSSAVGFDNTASGDYSSAFGHRVEVSTDGVQEFGKWDFSTGREGAIRIHDTGMAAITIENNATAYSASAAADGAEPNGSLADGMFAFRRDGTDVYLDLNAGGTIETKAVAVPGITASDLNNLDPIEVGDGNTASGTRSSAFGYGNTASGSDSSAFGRGNTASDLNSSAVGRANTASGSLSSAFGLFNSASAFRSSAVGYDNIASETGSSAFGYKVEAVTTGVSEFGKWDFSTGREGAIRIHDTGMAAITIEDNATAYTASAAATGAEANGELADGMFALRRDGTDVYLDLNAGGIIETKSFGVASNSIGADELNVSGNGTAGQSLLSDGDGTFSWGSAGISAADLNTLDPIEVGDGNTASAFRSSAVGYGNTASDSFASAFGYYNTADEQFSSAFGHQNTASGNYSSAFGHENEASGNYSSAFGYENTITGSGSNSSAVGYKNTTSGNSSSAFGLDNQASGNISTAVGYDNTASGYMASAFGRSNTASGDDSSAFGWVNTASGNISTAVGYNNEASGNSSSAFGYRVEVATNDVQEFGKWDSSTGREGAIRIHDTGMAAITIENNATAYTASAAANGAEANGELADGMFALRRDGDDILVDINIGGTVKTLNLGTAT